MIDNCKTLQEKHPKCVACHSEKEMVVKEKGKRYVLKNPNRKKVCRVRVDNCLIVSQSEKKCDFLILTCDPDSPKDIYLIELKGSSLIEAIEQLNKTIEYFKPYISGRVFARIVVSKAPSPELRSPKLLKLKKLLRDQYGGGLAYGTREYSKDILE
jgi:hypothetical protein